VVTSECAEVYKINKDVISIDSRKVTPVTRSAEAGPEFTVEKVEKYDEATLTVTASATEAVTVNVAHHRILRAYSFHFPFIQYSFFKIIK
jgi:hypothetical protein